MKASSSSYFSGSLNHVSVCINSKCVHEKTVLVAVWCEHSKLVETSSFSCRRKCFLMKSCPAHVFTCLTWKDMPSRLSAITCFSTKWSIWIKKRTYCSLHCSSWAGISPVLHLTRCVHCSTCLSFFLLPYLQNSAVRKMASVGFKARIRYCRWGCGILCLKNLK